MKLSAKQLRPLLFGAVEVSDEQGGLRGYKCSEPLRETYYSFQNFLKKYAEAPTGIRLDFETDSSKVTFTLTGTPFDLLIDGLFADRFQGNETPTEVSVSLDGKWHRITLIYPSHGDCNCCVWGMELSDGATVVPHKYRKKFLFLGDSITQGWNSDIDSLSYAWRTSLFFDADCIIHGVGGSVFYPPLFEAPPDFDPDLVFIAFGTNDFSFYKTLEDLKQAVSGYLDLAVARYGAERIRGITPIWRYDSWKKTMGTFEECIAVIEQEYKTRGIAVIDGMTLVPHRKEFFVDSVHPNGLGFGIYAERLIQALTNGIEP